jgi:hypothetical protein
MLKTTADSIVGLVCKPLDVYRISERCGMNESDGVNQDFRDFVMDNRFALSVKMRLHPGTIYG